MRDRSPALPEQIEIFFAPRPCGTATWDGLPSLYQASATLDDADLVNPDGSEVIEEGSGVVAFRDTCGAIYNAPGGGAPSNAAHLQTLVDRLGKDWWSWRLVNFDTVYNGVIAPDLDGYTDEIAWTYTAERCETRTRSAPWDDYPETYNHDDAVADCPQCFQFYAPDPTAGDGGACTPVHMCLRVQDGVLKWDVVSG